LEVASGSAITRLSSLEAKTGSYATTGSNTFDGGQYLSSSFNPTGFSTTASLYTDGGLRVTRDAYISGTLYLNNVTVFGTQSVAYISSSQLNIGTNIISVNTDIPSVRFGGLAVYDSGSTGLTGSMLWDSQDNQWIYSNPSGSTYDSAMFLVGPRNTGALGGEVGINCNFLSKGNGMHHMTSSAIFENGSVTCIPTAIIGGSSINGTTLCVSNGIIGTNSNNLYLSSNSTASEISFWGNQLNTRLMTLNGCGNLGIGISNPLFITGFTTLQVNGTVHGLVYVTGTCSAGGHLYAGNGGVNMGATSPHPLAINTNDTARITISSTGISCFACQVCAPSFIGGTVSANTTISARNGWTSAGNNAAPFFDEAIILGQSGNHSKIQYGNSFAQSAGTWMKFVVNINTANNTPVDALTLKYDGTATFGTTASTTYGTLNIIQQSVSAPSFVRGIELVHPNGTGATGGYIGISMTGQKQGTIQVGDDGATGNLLLQSQGGNVGIGTTSPPTKFAVKDGTDTVIQYYASGADGYLGMGNEAGSIGGGGKSFNLLTGTQFTFSTGGSERMRITSAGATVIRPNCIGLSDVADRTLLLGSRPGNSDIVSFGFDPGGTWKAGFDYKGSDGQLEWWTNNGSWCRRIMYTPTGLACFSNTVCAPAAIFTECVGINTTSPGATLHVGGTTGDRSIFICSSCKTTNPAYLRLIGVNSNDATTQFQIVHRGNHSNGGFTDRIDFGVNNGTLWCERVIRLDFNGNVGMCEGSLSVVGGVKFGNGSSTLNYYEQGTWTPRVTNGSFTTNAGTENAGWYIRVGNIVTVGGTLNWSGGSGAQDGNSLRIACLPFAANNTSNYRSVGQFGAPATDSIGFKNACSQMVLVVDPGASFIYIIQAYQNGTYLTYRHDPLVANAGTIYGFQATYITG
jgi:hypothetical protein